MKNKRIVAIAAAACMMLTTVSAPVFASEAPGFSEKLNELLSTNLEMMNEQYEEAYNEFDEGVAVDAEVKATLGSGAAALLQSMNLDLSWLDNVKITFDETAVDDKLYSEASALLNDHEIVGMQELYDLASQTIYYKIPALSDQSLKGNMEEMIQMMAASVGDDENAQMALQLVSMLTQFHSLKDFQAMLPAPETFSALMGRYIPMVYDHMQDEGSEETTVTLGDVSVDATAYSATMGAEDMLAYTKDLMESLKTDEDVKAIFDQYFSGEGAPITYDDFLKSLDEASAEMAEATPEDLGLGDDFNMDIIYWIDANDKIIGEYMGYTIDGEKMEVSFLAPNDGEKCALSLELILPESMTEGNVSNITLTGAGTVTDGAIDGTYVLGFNGTDILNIEAQGVTSDPEAQTCSGTLDLSVIAPEDGESSELAMASAFSATISYNASPETAECALSVKMSGMELATISFTANKKEVDPSVIPAAETFEPAIDITDEEQLNEFASSIDPTVLIGSLIEAGMPEEFLTQIFQMAGGEAASEEVVAEPAA